MKKISSLFKRDGEVLTAEFHPDAFWVVAGQGVATRKYDGTACRWSNGVLWARFDAKRGKTPPPGFVPCQDPDPITGHHPGWVRAEGPTYQWIRAALDTQIARVPEAGHALVEGWSYEACGPKIDGNREDFTAHELVRHGDVILRDAPRDRDGLIAYFTENDIEGIVWWRDINDPDCDKIKITGAALGVPRRKS